MQIFQYPLSLKTFSHLGVSANNIETSGALPRGFRFLLEFGILIDLLPFSGCSQRSMSLHAFSVWLSLTASPPRRGYAKKGPGRGTGERACNVPSPGDREPQEYELFGPICHKNWPPLELPPSPKNKDLALRSPFTSLCQQRQSPRFYYRLFLFPSPKVSFRFPMQLLKKSQLISFFLLNTFVLCGFWENFIFTHFLCYLFAAKCSIFSLFLVACKWHTNKRGLPAHPKNHGVVWQNSSEAYLVLGAGLHSFLHTHVICFKIAF